MWDDVGIVPYEKTGVMPKKIFRCTQNDNEIRRVPASLPLEGKGDRRMAVDEVEKRRIKVCYWFSAILQMCATIILLKSYWFSQTSSASLRSAPSPRRGKLLFSLRWLYVFFSWDTLQGNFYKVNNLDTKLPKGLPPEKREAFGCYQSMELLAKKGAYDAAQFLGRICTRRAFASTRRLLLLYNNKIILSTIFCDK